MGMLDNKVAIVTGATSGIGKRTAELFVTEGAAVVFTGRRKVEGEAIAQRLGKGASYVAADATSEADWQRVTSFAMKHHGRIDALFNNAGGPAPTGGIEDISVDGFDNAMALLVRSVMLGMKHVAPIMKRQRGGSILNNGSVAAHAAGYSSSMVYSAAKAAVVHFTRCVAMELGEYGVRVKSVSPGAIATGIFAKALGMTDASKADALADRMTSNFATMQPIPRSGIPDDIAQCVCWLASDRSTFINGEDVIVDGGLVRGRLFTPQQIRHSNSLALRRGETTSSPRLRRGMVTRRRNSRMRLRVSCHPEPNIRTLKRGAAKRSESVRMFG
jgi:NAD(P)-dependent dehydrogenase (short-subunit alcohol dehydrogenase family)